MFIHLVVIAWLYVAVMMAVAEATATNGTVLGAVFTFLLYGLLPVALVVYLLATPARRRAAKEREARAQAAARAAAQAAGSQENAGPPQVFLPPSGDGPSDPPDQGGEAPAAGPVAPVRKEP
ncbi:Uncharacterised protein [Xylophilus ampelinus]|nr:Uncharacterised protein [Xylophilus ampelinus]